MNGLWGLLGADAIFVIWNLITGPLVPCPSFQNKHLSRVLCKIGSVFETHLKLKSREISFVHNTRFNNPIVLKFGTDHGWITAVLCAKFQNDWTTEAKVMDERGFARFALRWVADGYPILYNTPGRELGSDDSCIHCSFLFTCLQTNGVVLRCLIFLRYNCIQIEQHSMEIVTTTKITKNGFKLQIIWHAISNLLV